MISIKSLWINKIGVPFLFAAFVIGAMVAWIGHSSFLSGYRATISFPMSFDVATYRRVDDLLHSAEWFREFARSYKTDPTLSAAIEKQFSEGRSKVIKFEHSFRVQRGDLRELPEAAMKELVGTLFKDARSDLTVTAKGNDAARSSATAELGIRFARHVLLKVSLTDWLQPWKAAVEREFIDIQAAILTQKASVDGLTRRMKDLEALRDRYRDVNSVSPAISGVQVQVTGPRYLAISQQLIGLESEMIDLRESQRQTEFSMEKIGTLREVVAKFEATFQSEVNSEKALLTMEQSIGALLASAERDGAPVASRLALTSIRQKVSTYRDRYVDSGFSPRTPVVRPDGLPRSLIVLAGALLGLLMGLAALRLTHILNRDEPAPNT